MKSTTIGGLAAALVFVVVIAACNPLTMTPASPTVVPPNPVTATPTSPVGSPLSVKGPLLDDFDRNLARWRSAGISRYAFVYTPSCFCPLRPHLVVGDGASIRIDGLVVDGSVAPPMGAPAGVEGLFAIVHRAILGDRATITYDANTGVPIAMDSDPIADAVDDELTFDVSDWTLQPPDDALVGRVAAARAAWNQRGISSYRWSIKITCECATTGRAYDITVKDGNASVRSRGRRIASYDLEGVPLTVPALFDEATTAAMLDGSTIAFDPEYRYPTQITTHDARPDAVPTVTIRVTSFLVG